jgi:hypothetical protein
LRRNQPESQKDKEKLRIEFTPEKVGTYHDHHAKQEHGRVEDGSRRSHAEVAYVIFRDTVTGIQSFCND